MIRRLLIRWGWIKPRWDDLSLRERLLLVNIRKVW